MNPLQEKKIKEFREKFLEVTAYKGGSFACEKLEVWLTTALEEVYKAGKQEGATMQYKTDKELFETQFPNEIKKESEKSFKEGEKNGLSLFKESQEYKDLKEKAWRYDQLSK